MLTMDGVGEWATTSFGIGQGSALTLHGDILFPHSLGLLYSAFTYYTGFKVNSGEYKVMGLAPYGEPKYVDLILTHVIDLKDDGSFRLNLDYFDYCTGLRMTNDRFHRLFGGEPRKPESPLTQRDMDLARSIQEVIELAVVKIARHVRRETGMRYLCLAGGVALNCVANGKLLRERVFDRLWIQPGSGDAGGAIGAALAAYYVHAGGVRRLEADEPDGMAGSYLGPKFSQEEIEAFLNRRGYPYERLSDAALFDTTADWLAREAVIGWFQGRMEFGPRALGNRSIIGDARSPKMQSVMNLKIKYRESFRPFAPAVLEERVAGYFELAEPSPYMLLVAPVKELRRLPISEQDRHLFGIERLNRPQSDIPARDPSGLLGQDLDHLETDEPAVPRAAHGLRGQDWVRGPREHLLQRARRADRLHAGRRLPVLHADRDGRAGAGELPAAERAAAGARRRHRLAPGV